MGDYSDARYDEFYGYQGSLFQNTEYDNEDKEADEIYNMVDMSLGRQIR